VIYDVTLRYTGLSVTRGSNCSFR